MYEGLEHTRPYIDPEEIELNVGKTSMTLKDARRLLYADDVQDFLKEGTYAAEQKYGIPPELYSEFEHEHTVSLVLLNRLHSKVMEGEDGATLRGLLEESLSKLDGLMLNVGGYVQHPVKAPADTDSVRTDTSDYQHDGEKPNAILNGIMGGNTDNPFERLGDLKTDLEKQRASAPIEFTLRGTKVTEDEFRKNVLNDGTIWSILKMKPGVRAERGISDELHSRCKEVFYKVRSGFTYITELRAEGKPFDKKRTEVEKLLTELFDTLDAVAAAVPEPKQAPRSVDARPHGDISSLEESDLIGRLDEVDVRTEILFRASHDLGSIQNVLRDRGMKPRTNKDLEGYGSLTVSYRKLRQAITDISNGTFQSKDAKAVWDLMRLVEEHTATVRRAIDALPAATASASEPAAVDTTPSAAPLPSSPDAAKDAPPHLDADTHEKFTSLDDITRRIEKLKRDVDEAAKLNPPALVTAPEGAYAQKYKPLYDATLAMLLKASERADAKLGSDPVAEQALADNVAKLEALAERLAAFLRGKSTGDTAALDPAEGVPPVPERTDTPKTGEAPASETDIASGTADPKEAQLSQKTLDSIAEKKKYDDMWRDRTEGKLRSAPKYAAIHRGLEEFYAKGFFNSTNARFRSMFKLRPKDLPPEAQEMLNKARAVEDAYMASVSARYMERLDRQVANGTITPEQRDYWVARRTIGLSNQFVVKTGRMLAEAKSGYITGERPGVWRRSLEWYSRQNKATKILVGVGATAVFAATGGTAVAVLGGGAATAGAVGAVASTGFAIRSGFKAVMIGTGAATALATITNTIATRGTNKRIEQAGVAAAKELSTSNLGTVRDTYMEKVRKQQQRGRANLATGAALAATLGAGVTAFAPDILEHAGVMGKKIPDVTPGPTPEPAPAPVPKIEPAPVLEESAPTPESEPIPPPDEVKNITRIEDPDSGAHEGQDSHDGTEVPDVLIQTQSGDNLHDIHEAAVADMFESKKDLERYLNEQYNLTDGEMRGESAYADDKRTRIGWSRSDARIDTIHWGGDGHTQDVFSRNGMRADALEWLEKNGYADHGDYGDETPPSKTSDDGIESENGEAPDEGVQPETAPQSTPDTDEPDISDPYQFDRASATPESVTPVEIAAKREDIYVRLNDRPIERGFLASIFGAPQPITAHEFLADKSLAEVSKLASQRGEYIAAIANQNNTEPNALGAWMGYVKNQLQADIATRSPNMKFAEYVDIIAKELALLDKRAVPTQIA